MYVCICMYVCMYVCMYLNVIMCIYIHTKNVQMITYTYARMFE